MSRAMRDSGIPWIGEMPEEWDLKRMQIGLSEINEKNNPIKTDYVLSLTNTKGVIPYEEKGDIGNKSKDNHEEYKIAYPNTIVANSMNILIGSVGICNYYGCVSPVYYVFKNKDNAVLKYYNYILSSQPFQKYLRQFANGILEIRLRLSSGDILKRIIPVPSPSEQQAIADFLDKKCSEIDELISLEEKIIEELKAYKKSVITEAVTKGLNPDVPMKDSGIEWLGEVNAKYGISRLIYFLDLLTDGTHQTPTYIDGGIPFLSIKDMSSGFLDFSNVKYISEEEHRELSKHANIKRGDILFSRIGTMGVFVKVDTDEPFDIFVSVGLMKVKKNSINTDYLVYYLSSSNVLNYINQVKAGGGTSAAKFNLGDVSRTIILSPSKEEQQAIVDYLDKKCSEIDSLIALKQDKIEHLKDYKKSIIYEYTTGKKEVQP